MDVTIFQYLGAVTGIISVGVMSVFPRHIIASLYVHAFSCVAMGLYAYLTRQPGIYLSQFCYLAFDVVGIIMWTKHHKTLEKSLNKTIDKVKKEL